jgi:hypothetical protein
LPTRDYPRAPDVNHRLFAWLKVVIVVKHISTAATLPHAANEDEPRDQLLDLRRRCARPDIGELTIE